MKSVHLIYFSPAFSTKKAMRTIGEATGMPVLEYDITQGLLDDLKFYADDLVFFGVPVYAGRVPALATEILSRIKGRDTSAVIVCIYGNRDYDDALLELKDTCESNHFKVIAAGAFIARHSIFPQVAMNRPDDMDVEKMKKFAQKCVDEKYMGEEFAHKLHVKGNHPYREPSKIPLVPKGSKKCNSCGTCVKKCPVDAISQDNPRKTNKERCISCARCTAVCPTHARQFGGLLYKLASRKFVPANSARKEPDMFFLD